MGLGPFSGLMDSGSQSQGMFLYRPLGNFLLSPKEDLHYLDVLDHYKDVFRIYAMTGLFTAAFDFSPLRDQDLEEDIEKNSPGLHDWKPGFLLFLVLLLF